MTEAKKGARSVQDAKTPDEEGVAKTSSPQGQQDRIDMNDPALSGADAVALALRAKG